MDQENPKNFRCGIVSVVGRPNVGKSTLINAILDEKISIVSKVPQTTRFKVRGIYNDERGQIIFIDTPGLHLGRDTLDKMLIKSSFGSLKDADCIIHLVDPREPVGEGEQEVVNHVKKVKVPVILGLNKMDYKPKYLPEYITLWESAKGKPVNDMDAFVLLPVSGKTKENIDKLLEILFDFLPQGDALYPRDTITDTPRKLIISDTIREKLIGLMRDEVPHSIGVVIDSVEQKKRKVLHIMASIYVERDSQKEIVIGKNGQILKKAGTYARKDLEDIFEQKIFLDLHVKAQKHWRDNLDSIQEMGYDL